MWRRFFRTLLNAGRRSPASILTELKEQLESLYLWDVQLLGCVQRRIKLLQKATFHYFIIKLWINHSTLMLLFWKHQMEQWTKLKGSRGQLLHVWTIYFLCFSLKMFSLFEYFEQLSNNFSLKLLFVTIFHIYLFTTFFFFFTDIFIILHNNS